MDYALFQAINNLAGHSSLLDNLMILIAKYGPVFFALPLLLIWFRGDNSAKRGALLSLLSMGIAMLIGQVITRVYDRPRPFTVHHVNQLIAHGADASFPSDHTLFSFGIAGVILLVNRRWGVVSILFACLVAFSRVFVGVHYPGDVIGGAAIGLAVGVLLWQVRRIFRPIMDFLIGIAARLKLA